MSRVEAQGTRASEGSASRALPGRMHRPPSPSRAQGHQTSAAERVTILVIAGVAAAVGAFAPASPTLYTVSDVVVRAGAAALLTLAASRARRWTWLVLGGLAAVVAPTDVWLVVTGAGLVFAFVTTIFPRRRVFGALVGACTAQGLLRATAATSAGAGGAPGGGRSAVLLVVLAVVPVLCSAYAVAPSRVRRRVHWTGAAIAGFVVLATVLFGVAALLASSPTTAGAERAKAGLSAARDGRGEAASASLRDAAASFAEAHDLVDAWWARPAGAVPILATQVHAVEVVTAEGSTLTAAAAGAASQADIEQLKYTDGRIDIDRLRTLRDPLTTTATTFAGAVDRIHEVRSPWLVGPLADRVDEVEQELRDTLPQVQLAAAAARSGPDLLGASGPKRYVVLFTQPSEARGLGGFVGNWVELTAVDGRLDITASGRARDINEAPGRDTREVTSPPVPEDYLTRYGRFQPGRYFQDLTVSPDLPSVAAAVAQIYEQTRDTKIDGVLVVDPYALAALLQFTGPIEVPGFPQALTATNAADILVRGQYAELADTEARELFLEEAARATFQELVRGSLPGPAKVAEVLGPMVERHRLAFHAFDPDHREVFDRLGMGGAFPTPDGTDLIQLVTSNKGNNKIDAFLHREVDYEVSFDPATGAVESTLQIELRNEAPSSGLPESVIGSNDQGLPAGTNRLFLSVYSPLGLRSAKVGDQEVPLEFQHELGWSVYSRYLDIPPGGTATLELRLFGQLDPADAYRLHVRGQPLVNPDEVRVHTRAAPGWEITKATGIHVEPSRAAAGAVTQPAGDLRVQVDLARP